MQTRQVPTTWRRATIDGDTHTAYTPELGGLRHQGRHIALRGFGFEQRVVDDTRPLPRGSQPRH